MTSDEATSFQLFARNIIQPNSKVYAQTLLGAAGFCSHLATADAQEDPNPSLMLQPARAALVPILLRALSSDLRRTPPTYRALGTSVRAMATHLLFPPWLSPTTIPTPQVTQAAALVLIDLHRTGSTARPTDPAESWPTAASTPSASSNFNHLENEPRDSKPATTYSYQGTDPPPVQGSTATATLSQAQQQATGRVRNPTPSTLWSATIDAALGTVDVYLSSLSSTLAASTAIVPAWGSTFPLGPEALPPAVHNASVTHVSGQVQLLRHALYVLLVLLSAPAPSVMVRLPLARAVSWLASPLGSGSVLGASVRAAAVRSSSTTTIDAALYAGQKEVLPMLQTSALLVLGALWQRTGSQGSLTLLAPSAAARPGVGTTPPLMEVLTELLPSQASEDDALTETHLVVLRLVATLLASPISAPLGPDHPTTSKLASVCQSFVAAYLVQLPAGLHHRVVSAAAAQHASEVLTYLTPLLAAASPDPATTSSTYAIEEEDQPARTPHAVAITALATAALRVLTSPSAVTHFAPPALVTSVTRLLAASLQTSPGAVWAATTPGLSGLLAEVDDALVHSALAHSGSESKGVSCALHELRATLALVTTPRLVPVPEWGSDAAMESLLADVIEDRTEQRERTQRTQQQEEQQQDQDGQPPTSKRRLSPPSTSFPAVTVPATVPSTVSISTYGPTAFGHAPAASSTEHPTVHPAVPSAPLASAAPAFRSDSSALEPGAPVEPVGSSNPTLCPVAPTIEIQQSTQSTKLIDLDPSGSTESGLETQLPKSRFNNNDDEHLPQHPLPPPTTSSFVPGQTASSQPSATAIGSSYRPNEESDSDSDSDLPDLDAAPPSEDEMV